MEPSLEGICRIIQPKLLILQLDWSIQPSQLQQKLALSLMIHHQTIKQHLQKLALSLMTHHQTIKQHLQIQKRAIQQIQERRARLPMISKRILIKMIKKTPTQDVSSKVSSISLSCTTSFYIALPPTKSLLPLNFV